MALQLSNAGHSSRLKGNRKSSPSHVNTVVRGAQGTPGPHSGAPYPSCAPRSTEQDFPREPRLFPSSARSCLEGWGSVRRPRTAVPWPLALHHPTHGIQQDGGRRVPPGLLPPGHFLCPQYKTTHGHKVLCNLFMALLPDPAARGRILSSAAPADPCPFCCPVQAAHHGEEPMQVSQRWGPHQILLGGATRMLCDVHFHTAAMP